MELNFYRYVDGKKIAIQIKNNKLHIYDEYNNFGLEITLNGVKYLIHVLKNIRHYSNNQRGVYLEPIIRGNFGYRCWSNHLIVSRAKSVLDMLTKASALEIDKDKLDKLNVSNLKYIETKLPSGVKKVGGKILISLFSID